MKPTIQSLRDFAVIKEGLCLSEVYTNTSDYYIWQCKLGHQWRARGYNILYGKHWCPDCKGTKRLTIDKLQKFAETRGGKCLSTIYTNVDSKYKWSCAQGHEWNAEATNVLHGNCWCPMCSHTMPKTLKELQEAAAKRGGKLISSEYHGILAKYDWECSKGHRWHGNANNVINHGHWCRYCARQVSKPEQKLYEQLKLKFPNLLHNITGVLTNKRFELDMYEPNLKKAIEFDGKHWHSLPGVPERDCRKDAQCINASIQLMRIKELEYRENPEKVLAMALDFLQELPS